MFGIVIYFEKLKVPGWPVRARGALRDAYTVAGSPAFIAIFRFE